jgi:uncharacterized protein YciI
MMLPTPVIPESRPAMPVFAVHYRYADDPPALTEHRPAHRQFLRDLLDQGVVLAAGAYPDGPAGALLVFRADSADDVSHHLQADPFLPHGLIAGTEIRRWTQAVGPWAD